MGIPPVYRTITPAIASYNWVDIAEGTGVVKFYCASIKETTNITYILTGDSSFYSATIESSGSSTYNTDNLTKGIDLDFDLSVFNFPKIIKGTASLNMAFKVYMSAEGSGIGYVTLILKKYDGTSEITVGTATSQTLTVSGVGGVKEIISIKIPLTETHFKKGDILRLTVEGWVQRTSGPANYCSIVIGHDPLNRDGAHITPSTDNLITTLTLNCPFKIDI